MSVAMPHLFGDDGREPSSAYLMRSMLHGCVSREFTVFALGKSSPIVNWIRVLARAEHGRWGGPGVGVVGMCFTGGFALGVMADAPVVAPVLSQPGLPAPIGTRRKAAIDCTDAEFAAVKRKVAAGAHVLGLRFTCDTMVPAQRFATLRRELGDGFIGVEIDSSPGNPYGNRKGAHSVLTEDLIDREGSPTLAALHQVLDFLAARLEVTSGGG
jgi:dienelactone hydrolase